MPCLHGNSDLRSILD